MVQVKRTFGGVGDSDDRVVLPLSWHGGGQAGLSALHSPQRRTQNRDTAPADDGVDQGSRRLLNGMTWPVWWSSWRSSVYLVVEGRYDGDCGVELVPD